MELFFLYMKYSTETFVKGLRDGSGKADLAKIWNLIILPFTPTNIYFEIIKIFSFLSSLL